MLHECNDCVHVFCMFRTSEGGHNYHDADGSLLASIGCFGIPGYRRKDDLMTRLSSGARLSPLHAE